MNLRRGSAALLTLLFLTLVNLAWAEPCDAFREGRTALKVENLGTAYFTVLESALQNGAARLSGGVCVAGAGGWELRSEAVEVSGLPATPALSAADVTLVFSSWTLQAASLQTDTDTLTLNDPVFRSGTLQGRADAAVFGALRSDISLSGVAVTGKGFRVEGAMATLEGERLVFQDALATTCVCAEDALYVIRAPTASYDLTREAVRIEGGKLLIGAVQVSLPNIDVTPEKLKNLTFPVRVEYVSDNNVTGVRGTGLGIRVPAIGLGDGLKLEVGAFGFDTAYPVNVVLLAHYRDDRLAFDVGRAAKGVPADITLTEALTPAVSASFAVYNRDWRDEDFLHEGVFALQASERVTLFEPNDLALGAGGFAAASYQFLGEPVSGPRLGVYQELRFLSPPSRAGRFGVSARAELTTYPGLDRTQVGFGFRPSWAGNYGPLRVNVAWDSVWTNQASPFGVSLDRLEPRNLLVLGASVDGDLGPALHGTFSVSARYDFLGPSGGAFSDGIETLALGAVLSYRAASFELTPFFRAELAPLFNERLRGETDSFVEVGLDLDADPWSFGLTFRADPLAPKITKLEARTSFPITLNAVTVKPFLAFDFAPTLTAGQFPRVSGHGLEVTYRSCCGTLVVGYRQLENTFTTSFAVRFE
ncbi:hypothetical protein BH24DEI2_BH24DEI2_21480 [soil metagenome]